MDSHGDVILELPSTRGMHLSLAHLIYSGRPYDALPSYIQTKPNTRKGTIIHTLLPSEF